MARISIRTALLVLGAFVVGILFVCMPLWAGIRAGIATRPAPTAMPTATPRMHCDLSAIFAQQGISITGIGLPDGSTMPFLVADKIVTIQCDHGSALVTAVAAAPAGKAPCFIDANVAIPDGKPWKLATGEAVICSNGTFIPQTNAPSVPAPTAMPTPVGCSADGFTFKNGDPWKVNGQDVTCVNGGWKPKAAAPVSTAAPVALPRCYPYGGNGPFLTDGQTIEVGGQIERCDGATGQMGLVGPVPTAAPNAPSATPVPAAIGPIGCSWGFFNPAWAGLPNAIQGISFVPPGSTITWTCTATSNGLQWMDP